MTPEASRVGEIVISIAFLIFGLGLLSLRDEDSKVKEWPFRDPYLRLYQYRWFRIFIGLVALAFGIFFAIGTENI